MEQTAKATLVAYQVSIDKLAATFIIQAKSLMASGIITPIELTIQAQNCGGESTNAQSIQDFVIIANRVTRNNGSLGD